MHNIKHLLIPLFPLILFGCSNYENGELRNSILDSSCRKISEDLIACDFKEAICSGEDRLFEDKKGDIEIDFIDLTHMKYTIGDNCIGLTLTMVNLPKKMKFNHSELADNANNYTWTAFFDIDNNDKPSKGDLKISVNKDNFDVSQELTGDILKNTNKSLTEIYSMADDGKVDANVKAFISATIFENSFYLYLPKSLHPSLEKITNSTKVTFYTQFNNGKTRYRDSYPD